MAAGSASTCPKSGLIVKSNVKSLVTPILASKPPLILASFPSRKEFPISSGYVFNCEAKKVEFQFVFEVQYLLNL